MQCNRLPASTVRPEEGAAKTPVSSHRASNTLPALLCDALGDSDRADPPRLRADDLAAWPDVGVIKQELRYLGRLSASGFSGN